MPKGRHLKPDFFTDKNIVSMTPLARLLYEGLWCYAADCGHLDDEPIELKMRILPADNCDVDLLLDELSEHGRIERKDGVLFLPKLGDHARIDKRYETVCEACKARREHAGVGRSETARHGVTTPGDPPQETPNTKGSRGAHTVTTRADPPQHAGDGDGDGDGDGEPFTSGLTPDADRTSAIVVPNRPEVDHLCALLADRIEANGCKRPEVGKRWHDAARLMLDRDGRTVEEIRGAIEWSQADEFWRSNILSMPTLREKYDQLRLQAQRRARPSRQQDTDDIFDQAAQRMGVDAGGAR